MPRFPASALRRCDCRDASDARRPSLVGEASSGAAGSEAARASSSASETAARSSAACFPKSMPSAADHSAACSSGPPLRAAWPATIGHAASAAAVGRALASSARMRPSRPPSQAQPASGSSRTPRQLCAARWPRRSLTNREPKGAVGPRETRSNVTPSAQTSSAGAGRALARRAGEKKPRLPPGSMSSSEAQRAVECGAPLRSRRVFARPRSASLTRPWLSVRQFEGWTSEWTTPRAWRCASALATDRPTCATCASDASCTPCSEPPSMYSTTSVMRRRGPSANAPWKAATASHSDSPAPSSGVTSRCSARASSSAASALRGPSWSATRRSVGRCSPRRAAPKRPPRPRSWAMWCSCDVAHGAASAAAPTDSAAEDRGPRTAAEDRGPRAAAEDRDPAPRTADRGPRTAATGAPASRSAAGAAAAAGALTGVVNGDHGLGGGRGLRASSIVSGGGSSHVIESSSPSSSKSSPSKSSSLITRTPYGPIEESSSSHWNSNSMGAQGSGGRTSLQSAQSTTRSMAIAVLVQYTRPRVGLPTRPAR
ncbi:hypothetical protein M885DRAFT_552158 [Pelagophyceae sp. CCMP2097]|nr:hypothetical protein M885DRAFT_552158 [Pelagophyceae sp. CCMP2097]